MDYTAGSGRQSLGQASSEANTLSSAPANSIRARAFAASGGNVGMNSSPGAPHILLFERDQQLMGLLTNKLHQAGIECHTARTAVEVFDAIARYPIRMVLVNLAQAATARRGLRCPHPLGRPRCTRPRRTDAPRTHRLAVTTRRLSGSQLWRAHWVRA